MSCKGICIRHKSFSLPNKFRYLNGQKRCQVCQLYIKWMGYWCPCCGFRLRGNPEIRRIRIDSKQCLRRNDRS